MEQIRSDEIMRLIMNSALDAIICMDKSGNITLWTKQAEKIFGWSEKEVLGKSLSDIIVPLRYRERHKKGLQRYLGSGKHKVLNKIIELEGLKRDGKEFPVELTIVSIKQNGNEFFCAFLRDISERKKVEEELRESELRYRSLVEHAGDAIFIVSEDTSFSDVNTSACKLLGYTREELLRMKIADVYTSEELKKRPLNWKSLWENKVVLSQRKFKRKDGTEVDVELSSKVLEGGGYLAIVRDISERKKVEEQTLKEKTLSETLINGLPGVFYLYNKSGKFLRWNKNFETVSGYSASEINRMSPLDFYDVDEKELLKQKIENVFKHGKDEVEANFRSKSGERTPYYFNGWKIEYEGTDCLLGVGIDISTRVQAEEQQRKSESRYRALINQASDAIFITDLKGNFIDVNESTCAMTGYTRSELLKMTAAELVEQQDLKAKPIPYERFKAGEHIYNTRPVLHKKGHIIEIEINSKKIGDDLILSIARDVTERKRTEERIVKSEQKYRSLIDQASDPIMVTDFKGNFIDVNTALCETFGYTKAELLKMSIHQIVDRSQLKEKPIMFEFLATGKQLFSERRMMRRDGTFIEVEANVKKVDENYVMAIARDVTERKKVREELENSHEELRRLSTHLETVREEERTGIAREIHDELGQQLTGLKMDLSSLNKKIPAENKIARKKIADMMSLLNVTMKTVRHISSELRPGILDDLGLVDALSWQSSEFENRTGIPCQFKSKMKSRSVEKNLSTGIFRVYQETLTNIARHAKATKVNTVLEVNKDNITLKVQDNGKGFNQSEVKNKNTLGLVGMKERAMMFGGKINIESEKGKGTVVTLLVPLNTTTKSKPGK